MTFSYEDLEVETAIEQAAIRLVDATDGAKTLDDVARIHGRPAEELLVIETGFDAATVRLIMEKLT
jgi:hypothetical protein